MNISIEKLTKTYQFALNMTIIGLTGILLMSISWLFLVRASSRPA